MKANKTVPILYIDLDGTVRKGFDEIGRFVNKKEDVKVFEGMPQKLKAFKEAGWRIVAVSNQGGVSLGHLKFDDCAEAMMETHKQCGEVFDKMIWCIHHPDAKDPEFAVCWCRKPRAGMVIEAALKLGMEYQDECYPPHLALFVGDRPEDKDCANAANIKFMDAKEFRNKSINELLVPTPQKEEK